MIVRVLLKKLFLKTDKNTSKVLQYEFISTKNDKIKIRIGRVTFYNSYKSHRIPYTGVS